MAGASDPFSILNKGGQDMRVSQFQKKQATNRYWRGIVPESNPADDEDDVDIFPEARSFSSLRTEKMEERMKEFEKQPEKELQVEDIHKTEQEEQEEEEARKRVLNRRRQVQKSQVIADKPSEIAKVTEAATEGQKKEVFKKPDDKVANPNEVKVEVRVDGRAAMKARLIQKQKEEEELKKQKIHQQDQEKNKGDMSEEEDDESEEDEDDEEDDSDEEDEEEMEEDRPVYKMMKPVYIPKSERDYESKVEKEEIEMEEEKRKLAEVAKQQNRAIIMEQKKQQIIGEEEANQSDDSRNGQEFPNDDDDLNQPFELEQWKIRELKRIRKDRDAEIQREKEQAEMLRRANMTTEEIIAEDKKLNLHQKQDKRQYSYMQKYYHKGAFYQDDSELMQRDFNMPVGEELVDKSVLPDLLQKRRGNFGKKGQSKYTHLTDQDTTNFDPKFKVDQNLQHKMFSKQAGFKSQDAINPSRNSGR